MIVTNIGIKPFAVDGPYEAYVVVQHENGETEEIRLTTLINRLIEQKKEV